MNVAQSTLGSTLAVLLPHISKTLLAPQSVPSLREAASVLAPISRGILECRLEAHTHQIDLQQCISVENDEPARLASHILATKSKTLPVWKRLHTFCTRWQDSRDILHSSVVDIWLELDSHTLVQGIVVPSVFFGLVHGTSSQLEVWATAVGALYILLGSPLPSQLVHNLRRCFKACVAGTRISHIGVMLSRQTDALRVNIKGLSSTTALGFLEQIGWAGDSGELEMLLASASGLVDYITFCLDIGPRILPQIGLECFFKKQPDDEPRWLVFLDTLIKHKLCTLEKRNALLAWPGIVDPVHSTAPWPDHLIAASLTQPKSYFSVIERRLRYIKITCHPQQPLTAKAYLSFDHNWLNPQPVHKERL